MEGSLDDILDQLEEKAENETQKVRKEVAQKSKAKNNRKGKTTANNPNFRKSDTFVDVSPKSSK